MFNLIVAMLFILDDGTLAFNRTYADARLCGDALLIEAHDAICVAPLTSPLAPTTSIIPKPRPSK